MKKLDFEKMEKIQGGDWVWPWYVHVGCGIGGFLVGGGVAGVVGYGACLMVSYRG